MPYQQQQRIASTVYGKSMQLLSHRTEWEQRGQSLCWIPGNDSDKRTKEVRGNEATLVVDNGLLPFKKCLFVCFALFLPYCKTKHVNKPYLLK